jgi:glycosyltransferase involved in cell wall biosynthesis
MHLLFDARLIHRPLSGLERVQTNLLRELAAHPEISRLRALVQPGAKLPRDLAGLPIEPVEVTTSEEILAALVHPDEDQRPDVYHLSYFPDRNPWDVMLPLAARASVVEVHDAILNRHPEYYPDRATWEWYHQFVCRLVQNADRLLAHSKSVAREIETDLGGNPSIVDVAPLAVDPSLRQPLPEEEAQNRLRGMGIPAPKDNPYFVALGKDYPHKDHATMFRALARLKKESADHRELRIVCAGSKVWREPGTTTTDELLYDLGIESSVTWVQKIPDEDIKALIQCARGLIYPSLEEGFGLPPIEAMALGTPAIAADSMAIPEVCGDGALLFKAGDDKALADLMARVLAGGQPVAALIERGHAREQQYSWKRCADAVVACYRRAMDAAKKREVTDEDLYESLRVAVHGPENETKTNHTGGVGELGAWQERCLSAERHARNVEANRDLILKKLHKLEREMGRQVSQAPQPQVEGNGRPRPRWSLRRRMRKIRDGIRKRLGKG